jgi:hypothetical protein
LYTFQEVRSSVCFAGTQGGQQGQRVSAQMKRELLLVGFTNDYAEHFRLHTSGQHPVQ